MKKKFSRIFAIVLIAVTITGTGITLNPNSSFGKVLSFDNACYAADTEISVAQRDSKTSPSVIVPRVPIAVTVESVKEYMGFRAIVYSSILPTSMKDYKKMAVSISRTPFDVEKNGLP